jgi:hypothetical protein
MSVGGRGRGVDRKFLVHLQKLYSAHAFTRILILKEGRVWKMDASPEQV